MDSIQHQYNSIQARSQGGAYSGFYSLLPNLHNFSENATRRRVSIDLRDDLFAEFILRASVRPCLYFIFVESHKNNESGFVYRTDTHGNSGFRWLASPSLTVASFMPLLCDL